MGKGSVCKEHHESRKINTHKVDFLSSDANFSYINKS